VERIGQAEVRFVPYQKDPGTVARYYQAADVYIHAARAEVWGVLRLPRRLPAGLQWSQTAVGGIVEQIKGLGISDRGFCHSDLNRYSLDDATGLLVAAEDAQGMAFGVKRLLQDNPLRLRMGENAVRDAVQRFDLQRQADDFLMWYQEILKAWVSRNVRLPEISGYEYCAALLRVVFSILDHLGSVALTILFVSPLRETAWTMIGRTR